MSILKHIDLILKNDSKGIIMIRHFIALISVCSDTSSKKASLHLLIFGIFWGLGSTLSDDSIKNFENFLISNFNASELPKGSV